MGGVISGGKNPVIPSPLRNRKTGGIKINTGLIKIIINFNKVREEVKTLGRLYPFLLGVYKF